MSIHKSKGLEFPVVILAGLGRGFNTMDTKASVLFHKDLGLGPGYVNPELRITRDTIARIALKNRIKMESLAEEMRILYVACTRPRDKLILIGSVRDLSRRVKRWSKGVSPFQLARGLCHLDWIAPVVMCHPDGDKLRDLDPMFFDTGAACQFDYQWQVKIINHSEKNLAFRAKEREIDLDAMLRDHLLKNVNSPEQEVIWERLSWNYLYPEAVKIPSKVSVSQVKNLQARGLESLGLTPMSMAVQPRFMETAKSGTGDPDISGAVKGTIMHFTMQHLDFTLVKDEAEIDQQITAMVNQELLREEEAAVADRSKILNFFHSPLGQRVLIADSVHREVPFNLVYKASSIFADLENCDEELLLQGVIDLYFQEGEELVLVDYKTDHVTPANRADLIEKYGCR